MNEVSSAACTGRTFLSYPDLLDEDDRRTMLDWVLEKEDEFEPSQIVGGTNPATRVSLALADFGRCRTIIERAIKPLAPAWRDHFGTKIAREQRFDASLVAHHDGAHYKPHVNTGGAYRTRAISAVYYFHRHPKGFEGGELRLFRLDRPGAYEDIEPADNMMVAFPAMVPHEVRPVRCPSGDFADSRFAINLWVHRA